MPMHFCCCYHANKIQIPPVMLGQIFPGLIFTLVWSGRDLWEPLHHFDRPLGLQTNWSCWQGEKKVDTSHDLGEERGSLRGEVCPGNFANYFGFAWPRLIWFTDFLNETETRHVIGTRPTDRPTIQLLPLLPRWFWSVPPRKKNFKAFKFLQNGFSNQLGWWGYWCQNILFVVCNFWKKIQLQLRLDSF